MKKLLTIFASIVFVICIAKPVHAVNFSYTFDSLDEALIGIGPQNAFGVNFFGSPNTSMTVGFFITNNTGVTWTDFHIWDTTFAIASDSYIGPGTASYDPSLGGFGADGFDIVDLSVANGSVLEFSFDQFCTGAVCSSARAFYRGFPTTASVPEPSTLLLLGSGLVGLGFTRRRLKK